MRTRNEKLKVGALAVAVQGAFAAMAALPARAENDAAELKNPTNWVEIGAANVSKTSPKFGEYDGRDGKGGEVILNFGIRGGDGYGGGAGIRRWSFSGTDLGLSSRSLGASIADQGRWNVGVGYDELQHDTTTGYRTPYQGSMGGNNFVLPASFGLAANPSVLTAAQLTTYQDMDVHNTRKKAAVYGGLNLNAEWRLSFDYNRLRQTGAKLMAFSSDAHLAATGQRVSILPNPTNYTTDTLNVALEWVGQKAHLAAAYNASTFRDGFDRVTWMTYAGARVTDTMSTPPSNSLHQLNLTGGYALSSRTRLAGSLAYGRNTQNSSFVDPGLMITPPATTSLNGLVVTSHADLRLTDQTSNDMVLSAGIKYDKRDNRTASNLYNFWAINNVTPPVMPLPANSTIANYANTPLSLRKTQFDLAGDYRLSRKQNIHASYAHEDVRRWCSQYAIVGANCVVATASRDDRLDATYRLKAGAGVDLSAGYAYSNRRTDSDAAAIAAMIGTNGNPPGTTVLVKGLNAGDFIGFKPYFDASRRQNVFKGRINWQAGERVALGLNGRVTDDQYTDATYGVQKGRSWSLNLDGSYAYSDDGSITAYLTRQHRQRDMTSLQSVVAVTATATRVSSSGLTYPTWSNKLKDDDVTVGIGFKQAGLMRNRLELAGDLTYSAGATSYATQLNYPGTTTTGLTCDNPAVAGCGTLPDFRSRLTQFRLTGNYQLDKRNQIALGYLFQKLSSNDWYYNAYQYPFNGTSILATNQQSGSYSVNVVSASYVHSFK